MDEHSSPFPIGSFLLDRCPSKYGGWRQDHLNEMKWLIDHHRHLFQNSKGETGMKVLSKDEQGRILEFGKTLMKPENELFERKFGKELQDFLTTTNEEFDKRIISSL